MKPSHQKTSLATAILFSLAVISANAYTLPNLPAMPLVTPAAANSTPMGSHDGNAAVCISLLPDGSLDDGCRTMLKEVSVWLRCNGEGIYASHTWKIPGEGEIVNGKLKQLPGGKLSRPQAEFQFGPQDFRFTVGTNGCLYAYCMTVPAPGTQLKITSLGTDAKLLAAPIQSVALLGGADKLVWSRQADGLVITCPEPMPFPTAVGFKIKLPQPLARIAGGNDSSHNH